MKDFKKTLKMADGGSVDMSWDDIQKYVDKAPERKAAEEQRMKTYTENNAKNSAQFKQNMSNISKEYDTKIAEAKAKYQPSRVGGGGGSSAGGAAADTKQLVNPRAMKTGGKVKRGNKK